MESFYDYYNTQGKSDVEMVNVDIHAFRATVFSLTQNIHSR